MKEVGFDKPTILWHYGDYREETFPRTRKVQAGMTVTPEPPYGKQQNPVVKKADTARFCILNNFQLKFKIKPTKFTNSGQSYSTENKIKYIENVKCRP